MPSPDALSPAERRARLRDERFQAIADDAALATLGLPPAGVAAVAPFADTPEARQALAEYVLGVLHRAGLAAAFQALCANDALDTRDAGLCRLVGAELVEVPQHNGPTLKQWVLPPGVPSVPDPEALARDVAGRLVTRETVRAEGRGRE